MSNLDEPQVGERYLIFHLVRHTNSFYEMSPEEEAASQKEVNEFILSWAPEVRLILGAHALGLTADWDWLGVFAVTDLSIWEAMREEYRRKFRGRIAASLSLPGVSHSMFTEATASVEHYKRLRELGVAAGGAESNSD